MKYTSQSDTSETLLVFAPTHNDSDVIVELLAESGITAIACANLLEMCKGLTRQDCGGVILAEEALTDAEREYFQIVLGQQDRWSDIPVLLMIQPHRVKVNESFSQSGNIFLLEHPFSRLTLVRSVQMALRARKRQYIARDLVEKLQISKDSATCASTSKAEFLANMSHEIRTPIGAILGFTELMKNESNTREENLRYTRIVERNSQHLLSLIDDILELSKADSQRLTVKEESIALVELLADFASVMEFKAKEKRIDFDLKICGTIPERVVSDPVRLKQILSNVVGNAIKFTHVGRVELEVSFQGKKLIFTVKDTGVGISSEQAKNLFQPFSQADTSTTRKFGGTGLGLVLSRRLSEVLGGDLELKESAVDEGATFVMSIQPRLEPGVQMVGEGALAFGGSTPKSQNPSRSLRNLKVLLVEDSPDNQTLFSLYLKSTGASVDIVSDGKQGVARAREQHFDVILMDIQMPEMDGHQATQALRKLEYSGPIIALTAHALAEERTRCFQSGFNDYLTKPIRKDDLIAVLSRYMPIKDRAVSPLERPALPV